MLCQRARQLLAPPRGPLSAIGGIDSLRHAEAGCQTQASDSPALPHRLPPVSISAAVVGQRPARRNRRRNRRPLRSSAMPLRIGT